MVWTGNVIRLEDAQSLAVLTARGELCVLPWSIMGFCGRVGEWSEKVGSFFPRQERNYSNDAKSCSELILFPRNLQLHVQGLG